MEKEEEHQKPSNENNVSDSMSEDNQTKKQTELKETLYHVRRSL